MKKESLEKYGSLPYTKDFFSRDRLTGELQDLGEIEIRAKNKKRNSGFIMLWTNKINPQSTEMKLLFFMLKAAGRDGILHMTNEAIAKKFGICKKTVITLKQTMRKEGFIRYEGSHIMLNPNVFWKGSVESREKAEEIFYGYKE